MCGSKSLARHSFDSGELTRFLLFSFVLVTILTYFVAFGVVWTRFGLVVLDSRLSHGEAWVGLGCGFVGVLYKHDEKSW